MAILRAIIVEFYVLHLLTTFSIKHGCLDGHLPVKSIQVVYNLGGRGDGKMIGLIGERCLSNHMERSMLVFKGKILYFGRHKRWPKQGYVVP